MPDLPSPPEGKLNIVGDYLFGEAEDGTLSGIFVYERGGVLCEVEVYGLAGNAPKNLPPPHSLRPFEHARGPSHSEATEPSPASRT